MLTCPTGDESTAPPNAASAGVSNVDPPSPRYASPTSDPAGDCAYCVYTDIGLASTPDGGRTWIYRGTAAGVDVPVSLRNASDPSTRPPAAASQMYGGATWWRPAVVRTGGVYHGFWVYNPAPGSEMTDMKIIHYTSSDLKNWKFAEVARDKPTAYDTVVFRVADAVTAGTDAALNEPTCGPWILYSTEQTRPGHGPPRQSRNLYNWTDCTAPGHQIDVGEGPHVTGSAINDATSKWNGFAWLNWEGGFVARSSDGGQSWAQPPAGRTLFDPQVRTDNAAGTDHGSAHQGPLIPQGDQMYVLYFTEFANRGVTGPEAAQIFQGSRSVLHIGRVRVAPDGWLSCNRSESTSGVILAPPPNPGTATATAAAAPPPVWAVAEPEAMVIALAELNRWHGGWYVPEPGRHPRGENISHSIVYGFRIGAGYYREEHTRSAETCVALCKSEPVAAGCGAVVFKENGTAGGLGPGCAAPGLGCCYLITTAAAGPDPSHNCELPCTGWDSWAAVGLSWGPNPAPKQYVPNFGKWRDPEVARRYVRNATAIGAGAELVWQLEVRATDASTGQVLAYDFTLSNNGTITAMLNVSDGGAPVTPVRQFHRVQPFV